MDSLYVRYANALLSIAKDEKKVDEYKRGVKSLLDFFVTNDEVNTYLKSYFVKDDDKFKIIDELSKPFGLDNLGSFIKLLVKRHRFNSFKYIANEFIEEANNSIGIAEGYVYSAEKLSEEQIGKIEEAISKRMNQKVELRNRVDTSLLGGVKVVINDRVYDGSLKNKIETMKTKLNERRI